jgi:hypothetical protein
MAHNTGINNIKIDEKQEVLSAIFLKTILKRGMALYCFSAMHHYTNIFSACRLPYENKM